MWSKYIFSNSSQVPSFANDYQDLSVLKRSADVHGIAILLIHHLRKEKADDVFNRISDTTAISGAVDASFTLVEQRVLHRSGYRASGTGAAPQRRQCVGGNCGQLLVIRAAGWQNCCSALYLAQRAV